MSDINTFDERLPLPEDAKYEVWEQVQNHGLKFESFNVTTEDGYINSLWHVWDPKAVKSEKVVLMMHGLLDSAGTWFYNDGDKSLGYTLAKQGYDIYLGNNRGNIYSYQHVNLTIEDNEYWQFSFHEMGKYDLPAFVDFVIDATGVSKINYIGHSNGNVQFWVGNCLHDDLGSKINKAVALGPVMYIT